MLWFKTKDDTEARCEFVRVDSLEPCIPAARGDDALVLRGEDKWLTTITSHTAKGGKGKSGIYCKSQADMKKKDAQFYKSGEITKLRLVDKGPPV